jgi:hypothetical protein
MSVFVLRLNECVWYLSEERKERNNAGFQLLGNDYDVTRVEERLRRDDSCIQECFVVRNRNGVRTQASIRLTVDAGEWVIWYKLGFALRMYPSMEISPWPLRYRDRLGKSSRIFIVTGMSKQWAIMLHPAIMQGTLS